MEVVALRRWLVLGEETETAWCPDFYPLFQAADRCNCAPWELAAQPIVWRMWALKVAEAEAGARKILEQHK